MSVIERSTWRAQPWKNGAGTTHEIWRTPDTEDYDLRVSLAEVTTSGPFSQFPGYRRYTFLVGPAPITLHGATAIELVAAGDHVELPGETALRAELRAGATTLLNVLSRVPLLVGHGPTPHAMRFVFDLAQQRAMRDVVGRAGCVWIA
jgi:environmental stress-induced protein Ves